MNPHKISREKQDKGVRKDRPIKRRQSFNPKAHQFNSSSAKKLREQDEIEVPEEAAVQYAILDFCLVFSTLSTFVRCSNTIHDENGQEKLCNGKIDFKQCAKAGLGFKIMVICEKCPPRYILSSQKVGTQCFEINRRFIFVMRILGLGLAGCRKFCGLMDLSSSFVNKSTYNFYVNKIHECIKIVAEKIFTSAAKNEQNLTCEENEVESTKDLTVSGDGTWKKRGFTSLYGVSTLIGYYSGKVLDIFVKSSYCKLCEFWEKKLHTAEFEEWSAEHIENNECRANHEGAAGNMEAASILSMFKRSMELYGVRYAYYIGDGDSKTYSAVVAAKPYGEEFKINKKECVGHVQKRMGTR